MVHARTPDLDLSEESRILDAAPPRFGRIRWAIARFVLGLTNLTHRPMSRIREWALEEAVASSPSYEVFEAFITRHYAARGQKATVSVIHATVTTTPAASAVANSTFLH